MLPFPLPRERRILYVASLAPFSTAAYRLDSLKHLGQQVQPFDVRKYEPSSHAAQSIRLRYPFGPLVAQVNRELRRAVATFRPDVVWFDKPTVFTRETMHAIRRAGAQVVFYVQDAPFGPRNDGCWRQFLRVYRMADLHCLLRDADVPRYRAWGLPWIKVLLSFSPDLHFPPPFGFSDADRDRQISYIGHPFEERPFFLLELARKHGLPVFVNGNRWSRVLNREELRFFTLGSFLPGDQYRCGIWRSRINLSFVTKENEEDIGHKAVEVAACGGFLLAVRTPGHQALFEEDREAVFFSSVEECADKARFYLGRPDLREAIAARGRERAVRSGYDNNTQLAHILNRLDGRSI
jgi:hypothetical protein